MSLTATNSKSITADELAKLRRLGRHELLHGELIMMSPAGAERGVVAARFARFISAFVDEHQLGVAFGAETGFKT